MMLSELLILSSALLATPGDEGKALFEESFDGRLKPGWEWVREDKEQWRFREGALEVHSQFGRIWGGNDAKNLLLFRPVKPAGAAARVMHPRPGSIPGKADESPRIPGVPSESDTIPFQPFSSWCCPWINELR